MFKKLSSRRRATGVLREYYDVPRPGKDTPLADLPMLAVDVETTGLNPAKHRLLSIGWVPLNGLEIDLSGAGYVLLNTEGAESVGESAVIHGLTDDQVAQGLRPQEALEHLLRALKGRAMLAHYASIEQEFLSAACRAHFGSGLSLQIVDTFEIERRHMERMATYPRGEDLRLPRVRERYGLPHYSSHNALSDALACAELYLALQAQAKGHTLKAMQPR
ncbi:exonuclease domain-containing protein [Corynebacterium anserum]|uniref:3'-5' exonuclease n=1 Tax=Corynebacterium anserum TaxID=2684406 RepID=A0A7G7YP07_9CORY|nr:exonuclease domain-containing protein [Corynebacterium anserum]MBC2681828.1 3'-5' exonuclease [Corynebacterium anserum]QNH96227.1 3'-5' exonuclease [Corynebacterium anserum]